MISLTDLTQKQWCKTFEKLGYKVDKKKGKGSHFRVVNPGVGNTTIPHNCHKFISLELYKALLKWGNSEQEIDSALK